METSIVIFTYNRSNNLTKTLKLHQSLIPQGHKIHFYVMDGSTDPNEARQNKLACEQNSAHYFLMPDPKMPEDTSEETKHLDIHKFFIYGRMYEGTKKVSTKTMSFLDDNDIIHMDTLFQCVSFIEQNADYVCAGGIYKGCDLYSKSHNNRANLYDIHALVKDVTCESPIQRMAEINLFHDSALFYDVTRTKDMLTIMEVCQNIAYPCYFSAEYLRSSLKMLFGKRKFFNQLYRLRVNDMENPSFPNYNIHNSILNYIYADDLSIDQLMTEIKKVFSILIPDNIQMQQAAMYTHILAISSTMLQWSKEKVVSPWLEQFDIDIDKNNEMVLKNPVDNWEVIVKNPPSISLSPFKTGDKIAVYGAGSIGKDILKQLNEHSFDAVFFIDANYDSLRSYCNKPVVSVNDVMPDSIDYIIIASDLHETEMAAALRKQKINDEKIIFLEPPSSPFSHFDLYQCALEKCQNRENSNAVQ